MPWCPNCKTEYREGITVCADCKTELVAEYKDVLLKNATELLVKVDTEHRIFTQKLHDFLEYSNISSVLLTENDMVGVYVAPEDFKKAKKCFKAFYSVETEISMQHAEEAAFLKGEDFLDYFGDDDEEESDAADHENPPESPLSSYRNTAAVDSETTRETKYSSAISKYEDYRSSGYTFTVLGALGIGFALLNFLGVFSLFGSAFSSTVLFLMFGIFLALGIFSFMKASSLKDATETEKQQISDAKEWMQQTFTKEFLASLTNDDSTIAEHMQTAELLYLERVDQLVGMLHSAFPLLHETLAEQLIEEFCNQNFEEE